MKANLFQVLLLLGVTSLPVCGSEPQFSAHEWGTFTSVQGADGVQTAWNPLLRTDLPSFVYDHHKLAAAGCGDYDYPGKAATMAIVRMETPVIYFYSAGERTVDVRVEFPQGRITEWYPRASALGPRTEADAPLGAQKSFLEWNGVRVLAPGTKEISAEALARGGEGSHYYAARETEANLLCMAEGQPRGEQEYERLLFYRGVGNFQAPLQVRVTSGEQGLRLATTNQEPLTALFALTVRGGQAKYRRLANVSAAEPQTVDLAAIPFSPLPKVRARLGSEIQAALVAQGLYAREAAAMVKTWNDQWFAEGGTRVLYLLPRAWTDRTLPLKIEPAPAATVRVMVGRSEVILPAVEKELHREIVRYSAEDPAARESALSAVRQLGLGRFLEPAVDRVLRAHPDENLADAAWRLARHASEPKAG